jgi:hypothetical protein
VHFSGTVNANQIKGEEMNRMMWRGRAAAIAVQKWGTQS